MRHEGAHIELLISANKKYRRKIYLALFFHTQHNIGIPTLLSVYLEFSYTNKDAPAMLNIL